MEVLEQQPSHVYQVIGIMIWNIAGAGHIRKAREQSPRRELSNEGAISFNAVDFFNAADLFNAAGFCQRLLQCHLLQCHRLCACPVPRLRGHSGLSRDVEAISPMSGEV